MPCMPYQRHMPFLLLRNSDLTHTQAMSKVLGYPRVAAKLSDTSAKPSGLCVTMTTQSAKGHWGRITYHSFPLSSLYLDHCYYWGKA